MIRITSIDHESDSENFKVLTMSSENSSSEKSYDMNNNNNNDNDNNDNDNSNNNNNNNDNNINDVSIISREREIFLRAALQLLDCKDFINFDNNQNSNNSLSTYGRQRSESLSLNVIKYGRLKKASRSTGFSGNTIWKIKYIEICHGLFSYEDEGYNGFMDNWSIHKQDNENKNNNKIISLNINTCRCRAYKKKPGVNDMFELSIIGGTRRIWQASSEEERDEWVNAIKNAMIGSAGDFIGQSVGQPVINLNENSKRSSISSTFFKNSNHCELGFSKQYTPGITVFKNIRNMAHSISQVNDYRNMLDSIKKDKTKVTVPVSYIKMTMSNSNSFRDTPSLHSLGRSVDSSQVWKDLQRDTIRVNGDIISGENGPEAMIGSIVRHIFDKVQTIKAKISASLCEGILNGSSDTANDYSFDLTEAQVMACARDLLIFCNRTQSGGDTYFCVDSLLCNKEKELCILAPLASESDPLEIFVDIVQGTSHPIKSSNGNDDISIESNNYDDDSTGVTSTSTNGADLLREISTTSTGDVLLALNESSKVSTKNETILSDSNHSKSDKRIGLSDSNHSKSDKRISLCDTNNTKSATTDTGYQEGIETRRKAQLSLNLDEKDGVTLLSSSPQNTKYVRKSLDENIKNTLIKNDDEKKVMKWDDVSIISDITIDSTINRNIRDRRHSDPNSSLLYNRKETNHIIGKIKSNNNHGDISRNNKNVVSTTISTTTSTTTTTAAATTTTTTKRTSFNEKIQDENGTGFLSMLKTPLRRKKERSPSFEEYNSPSELPRMCVRIQVKAISKYRICDYNPQDEQDDTWGVVTGEFQQCFFLKSNCNGRPSMSDRMVSISMQ